MSTTTLPVRAVRERTFLTPDGRYTIQLKRPREYRDADGWVSVEWAVLVSNPDKTRVIMARGQEMMPRRVALSTVDAMLRVLPDAWRHRVGPWRGDDGHDWLTRLGLWATYRRDARVHAESAHPNRLGEQTTTRGVRCARVAWARYFGWDLPLGYVDETHLTRPTTDNPTD